ncbi:MAG TPA: UDP-N-acetylmuramoyl-L-alanyl-D-glutamate--2,6-diaminopimelate ligase [Acidimicrobiales bacterium]|jgi:UDP-N-acetylmuramoyl-L-alanyl-D-glutamate--2,6-diaminopimelate ligase|nr:UDP-N-acetylmuramoyl-L-alanyl-D-glutamate--2,6-diaminopimelate ligase [Acidimicrobiales bacterium]
MNLLFDDIEVIESVGDPSAVEVGGISHDSRRVVPGDLFCCVPGVVSDGHVHAAEAVDRGAIGLLCEHFIPELIDQQVVQTRIAPGTMRPVMARLAAAFYGYPARDLLMIGVTGTNGKTTVTQLLGDLLSAAGRPTNVMGTLSGTRTTPEATEVQRVLAGVRDRQKSDGHRHAVAMEVSSHALVQSRVEGIHFDVAVFTNLSHDHLDYHKTMEEYFKAKAMLFTPSHSLLGVVQADDPWGQRLLQQARIPMTAVHHADATDMVLRPGRSEFTWRGQRIVTPLTGAINVDNALLAAEAALALEELDLGPEEIARAMGHLAPVPGRLQVVATPQEGEGDSPPFTVLVDYAHTPAGLEIVLGEARALAPAGRVLCVFGCGGNRDRAKRPLMGAAAAHLSDVAFLTSDNPRDEDPLAIMEEVLGGVPEGRSNPRVVVEPDRGVAIRQALDAARPGDIVVIAGKGHETYQEIGSQRLPFDDAVEARRALSARFGSDPRAWAPPAPVGAGEASTSRHSLPEA